MDLAKIADLKVISRARAMYYNTGVMPNPRKIGKQLGITPLIEGSVQGAIGR